MSEELVDALREGCVLHELGVPSDGPGYIDEDATNLLMEEAAAEIERLRAAVVVRDTGESENR